MAINIFFCYSHRDQALVEELKNHLQPLQRRSLIEMWYDRNISAGRNWAREISRNLDHAHIILLMISSDFITSQYCYSIEMTRALERHHRGEARVIPIILRPCLWEETTFSHLLALPRDGLPVTSWSDRDNAFLDITRGIRRVIEELHHQPPASLPAAPATISHPSPSISTENRRSTVQLEAMPVAEPSMFELVKTLKHSKFSDTSIVSSVAFSIERGILVSGGGDSNIKVWDIASGELQYSLSGIVNPLLRMSSVSNVCVAIARDGLTLAGGGIDNQIRIWRLNGDAKQTARALKGHREIVTSVTFSPDGSMLASGSEDKTIKMWNAHIPQALHTLQGHTSSVTSIAFSPNGNMLASGSEDRSVKVWDPHCGQLLYTLTSHTGAVTSIAFSPDGSMLASGSEDRTMKMWNACTRQLLHTFVGHTDVGHTDAITSVAFSPADSLLASSSKDKTIKIWRPHTGQLLCTLRKHTDDVTSVAFSPDGSLLASAGCDGVVHVWRNLKA